MMELPLVSVICLCYNHSRFISEAVESIVKQTYANIQIIVVDDASTDDSVNEILKLKEQHSALELVLLKKNIGNCKAFNVALKIARGKYIVDFATDDVMVPERIEKQVNYFEVLPENVGVVFTDATYIDEEGKFIRNHFEYLFKKKLISAVPTGDIYRNVVSTYFIPSPTMMTRDAVFATLGGYDENLTYEDFDFWVRSAREFQYSFLNERLTRVRKVNFSMSTGWYVPGDKQLHSTYLICKKIQRLNRDEGDKKALVKRVQYEFRQSVLSGNFPEAGLFYSLLKDLRGIGIVENLFYLFYKLKVSFPRMRKLYYRIRFS